MEQIPSPQYKYEENPHADVKKHKRNKKPARSRISLQLAALKSCRHSRDLETVKRIHAESRDEDSTSSIYLSCTLVSLYSKCGSLVDAHRVFDGMVYRNVVAWTALILGYAEEDGEIALELFARMQLDGCSPNGRTFVAAVKSCTSIAVKEACKFDGRFVKRRGLAAGICVHMQALGRGYASDVYLRSSLVEMYAKCGRLRDARVVFDVAEGENDVVIWTTLLVGYVENGEEEAALEMFDRMKKLGCKPNHRTYVAAVKACSGLADKEKGRLQVDGKVIKPVSLSKGIGIHSQAAVCGCDFDMFLASTLVDMYARCGNMVDAQRVFDRMADHDVVSWNALIAGYVGNREYLSALKALVRMTLLPVAPDVRTYTAGLVAAGSLVSLHVGKELHAEVCNRCLEQEPVLATSLVDFYGKCGSMQESQVVFDSMSTRDSVAWTALLGGYSRQGDFKNVFRLFRMMVGEGLHGDEATFVCVLALCSHAGLVSKGKDWFEAMPVSYGVSPCREHYHCLLDMFGRSGAVNMVVESL